MKRKSCNNLTFSQPPSAAFSTPSGPGSVYSSCKMCTGLFDRIHTSLYPAEALHLAFDAKKHISFDHKIELLHYWNTDYPQRFLPSLHEASNALVSAYLGTLRLLGKRSSAPAMDPTEKKQLLLQVKAITEHNLAAVLQLLASRYEKKSERDLI